MFNKLALISALMLFPVLTIASPWGVPVPAPIYNPPYPPKQPSPPIYNPPAPPKQPPPPVYNPPFPPKQPSPPVYNPPSPPSKQPSPPVYNPPYPPPPPKQPPPPIYNPPSPPNKQPPTQTTITVIQTQTQAPSSTCNTGPIQCCDSVSKASSSNAKGLLGLFNLVVHNEDNVSVGMNCNPIGLISIGGGSSCNAQTVCCENNSFNGLIAIGCSPIIINL